MGDLWRALRTLPAEEWKKAALLALATTFAAMIFPAAAVAQAALNVNLGTGAGLTERVVQLVGLRTVLSLAPSIVIMTTSFVRIVVVLSLLRTALGLQQSPPNAVIISLSLFLTAIVMGPTFESTTRASPLLDQQMELPALRRGGRTGEAVHAGAGRPGDGMFIRLSNRKPATDHDTDQRRRRRS